MTRWIAILCTGFFLSVAVNAQALTGDTVSRFIASMEELQTDESFSGQFMEAWEASREAQDDPRSLLLSDAVAFMEGSEGYATLQAVVKEHGFDSPQAWGRAGDRALLALTRLDMADSISEMQERLVGMRREVNNSTQFSDEQKQQMRAMIERTARMLERMEQVPSSDLEAVEPHRSELKRVLEYDLGN
ncbi:hypothetical protein ACJO2E_07615 [Marinobacter sp. M1N3S26]|uniref:hypothetical protein n=1 Tax=Marinobacter sp. M1N3S26 TaxID=3382299 RepID=UPI00387B0EE9